MSFYKFKGGSGQRPRSFRGGFYRGELGELGGVGALDPYFSDVTLLAKFDGSNGSNTFVDSSSKNHSFSVSSGSPQISTAQAKFAQSLHLVNSEIDALEITDAASFTLSADFTIECWYYLSSFNSGAIKYKSCLFSVGSSSSYLLSTIGSGSNDHRLGNQIEIGSGVSPSLTAWHHYALTRSGSSVKMFLDGVEILSTSNSSTLGGSSFLIGTHYGSGINSGRYFNGYIDELRVTLDVARYTSAFTPPSSAFPTS